MKEQNSAWKIAKGKMYDNDAFSKWLGIEIIEVKDGYCELTMTVREEMTNGFKIAHGGITYSLADSALAFASNACGKMAVSIETSVSHIKQLKEGDIITAKAKEISRTEKIGIYLVEIERKDEIVAHFKGTVYRTAKEWL